MKKLALYREASKKCKSLSVSFKINKNPSAENFVLFEITYPYRPILFSIAKDENFWQTLSHELSHLDQFLEWPEKKNEASVKALILFEEWIDRKRELSAKELKKILKTIIQTELDCVQRSAKKLKKYNLITATYIQEENTQILLYHIYAKYRSFLGGYAPFLIFDCYKRMPIHFDFDHQNPPKKLIKIFDSWIKENTNHKKI